MKFKRFLLPIFSFIIAIGVMAFTQKSTSNVKILPKSNLYVYYFSYVGATSPFSFSEYIDPNNYVMLTDPDIIPQDVCESGNDAVCLILCERFWNGFDWKPDFSNTTWGSAYWGLSNFYYSGLPGTNAVYLKDL